MSRSKDYGNNTIMRVAIVLWLCRRPWHLSSAAVLGHLYAHDDTNEPLRSKLANVAMHMSV